MRIPNPGGPMNHTWDGERSGGGSIALSSFGACGVGDDVVEIIPILYRTSESKTESRGRFRITSVDDDDDDDDDRRPPGSPTPRCHDPAPDPTPPG